MVSEPSASIRHPTTEPPSASIANRSLPSSDRPSSRRPGRRSAREPAAASSSAMDPSAAIAKRDTVLSAKLVVYANRSSGVTTAQQISLIPSGSERVFAARLPSFGVYDDAAAAPLSARNASVTMRDPFEANANP